MHGSEHDDEDVTPQTEVEGKGGNTFGALNNMIKVCATLPLQPPVSCMCTVITISLTAVLILGLAVRWSWYISAAGSV